MLNKDRETTPEEKLLKIIEEPGAAGKRGDKAQPFKKSKSFFRLNLKGGFRKINILDLMRLFSQSNNKMYI